MFRFPCDPFRVHIVDVFQRNFIGGLRPRLIFEEQNEFRVSGALDTDVQWLVGFRTREYSANGIVARRDDDGNVVIKVPRAELISRLVPDKSKKLKSKRANIQLLASRLVQNEAVLSHLTQVM